MSHIPYAGGVRSLMYMLVCTKPDMAYEINVVSMFMAQQGRKHLKRFVGTLSIYMMLVSSMDMRIYA